MALAAVSLAGAAGTAGRADAAVTVAAQSPSLSCPTTPYGVTETLATYGSPANGQALDLDEYRPSGIRRPTSPA